MPPPGVLTSTGTTAASFTGKGSASWSAPGLDCSMPSMMASETSLQDPAGHLQWSHGSCLLGQPASGGLHHTVSGGRSSPLPHLHSLVAQLGSASSSLDRAPSLDWNTWALLGPPLATVPTVLLFVEGPTMTSSSPALLRSLLLLALCLRPVQYQ